MKKIDIDAKFLEAFKIINKIQKEIKQEKDLVIRLELVRYLEELKYTLNMTSEHLSFTQDSKTDMQYKTKQLQQKVTRWQNGNKN